MRKTYFKHATVLCTIGLAATSSYAQVPPTQTPGQIIQPGQPIPGQVVPQQTLPGQVTPGQPYEARRVDTSDSSQAGQQNVQGFLVDKLIKANECEIELSKMAAEKASSEQVKEFAKMLVNDHQQLKEKLVPHSSSQRHSGQQGQVRAQDQQQTGNRPGSDQRSQANNPQGNTNTRQNREGSSPSGDRNNQAGNQAGSQSSRQTQAGGNSPLQQLAQISKAASDNHLEMTKQMLQKYEGQDFDMGFLGLQIASHGRMLADLRAIQQQNVGNQQFQQLVKQAEQVTTEHLDRAKQLASKHEKDGQKSKKDKESN